MYMALPVTALYNSILNRTLYAKSMHILSFLHDKASAVPDVYAFTVPFLCNSLASSALITTKTSQQLS